MKKKTAERHEVTGERRSGDEHRVIVKLTTEQYQRVMALAERRGLRLGQLMRMCTLAAAEEAEAKQS
jgi:hypothetical protein